MSTFCFQPLSLTFYLILVLCTTSLGQVEIGPNNAACYDPIIGAIGSLEADRDPKCHATANRLEDFMYGTPLSFEARAYRIELQKDIVYAVWSHASQLSSNGKTVKVAQIVEAADQYIKLVVSKGDMYLHTTDDKYVELGGRDMSQYSSIAYSLRAILAVQQRALFEDSGLLVLEEEAVKKLKQVIDMAMLSILKVADSKARSKNEYELSKETLELAKGHILHIDLETGQERAIGVVEGSNHSYAMLRKTIKQKLDSYQKYNELNQAVFLRNIQVYFAQTMWPKDKTEVDGLIATFQNGCISYGLELLHFAEKLSRQDSLSNISIKEMNRAVTAFLPYEVNEFEDVTYFPLLRKKDRVVIESYDLDAFRDSGLHWKILEYILDEPTFKGTLEPDPFASELLVEAIAQFGVLLWRMSGNEADAAGDEYLSMGHLKTGMDAIRTLAKSNNGRFGIDPNEGETIASADTSITSTPSYFTDVTEASGIDFLHRSADWLNRLLRSYVLKSSEKLARLGIPPAFGGGGVAAEDINHDGYDDILLLSGLGNKLYLNNGDKTFTDITKMAGIENLREDGTYTEPRQPIIADFNNDGHQDIFISYVYDDHRIYMGDGTGKFVNKTGSSKFGGRGLVGGPCTALDYNNDGLLDLYIGYFGNYMAGELPTLARSNTNGSPNQLFKNLGDFDFQNVTEGSGVDNEGWTQAVGHTDINNDGWQDIIAGNDFGNNGYYINQGDGTFIDKSDVYNTDKPSYTMNIGITDLNRDNFPDFYISNIVVMEKDDKYVLPNEGTQMHFDPSSLSTMRVIEANDLFLSTGGKSNLAYTNSRDIERGFGDTGWSWDADFFDSDNDGDDDLYCLNGMNPYSVYGTTNKYYKSPEGTDADVVFSKSHSEHNVFFKNEGGKFYQSSEEAGLDLYHTSRSAAYTDYDNDGDLDIILSNYHGKAYFYENNADKSSNNWIKIKLRDDTWSHNKDAIGSRIIVDAGDNKGLWREVHSTDGYLSGHPKTMHFGVGKATSVTARIVWQDGHEDAITLEKVNELYEIVRKGEKINVNPKG